MLGPACIVAGLWFPICISQKMGGSIGTILAKVASSKQSAQSQGRPNDTCGDKTCGVDDALTAVRRYLCEHAMDDMEIGRISWNPQAFDAAGAWVITMRTKWTKDTFIGKE